MCSGPHYGLTIFLVSAQSDVGWLVGLGLTRQFETVFQSISDRLSKKGRKERKDRGE